MIPLVKSTFYQEEQTKKQLCAFITSSKKLSFGQECQEFEKEFSQFQKRKYTIMVNSGSSANLAIIQALMNLKKLHVGDKVGFSALTWSTNVMPLIELGLIPVPIDVEIESLNVSSALLLETLKRENLKALFITHLLGFCDDIDVIQQICKNKKILLIEDTCESLGTVYRRKKLGNFGIASTFSFYVGHHMSTIEGGAVCTNDRKLSDMLHLVRAHGWDRNLSTVQQERLRKRYKLNTSFYSRYTFYDLGYNFRPTEIAGFLGRLQLTYLPEIIAKREQNFHRFSQAVYSRKDLYFPLDVSHLTTVSNFAVPIICRSVKIRDQLVKMCENQIEIRPVVGGEMTKQPFFTKYFKQYTKRMKHSSASLIHRQGLYFGNNPELTTQEIEQIIDLFTKKI